MNENWDIQVFFDGDCPLCEREINLLKKLDHESKIDVVDIAAPSFKPEARSPGKETLMAEIHGRLPDGRWITGVEVFRRLYAAVGFRRLVWASRLPGISHALDFGYHIFARNRLRLTGRCENGACRIPKSADKT